MCEGQCLLLKPRCPEIPSCSGFNCVPKQTTKQCPVFEHCIQSDLVPNSIPTIYFHIKNLTLKVVSGLNTIIPPDSAVLCITLIT